MIMYFGESYVRKIYHSLTFILYRNSKTSWCKVTKYIGTFVKEFGKQKPTKVNFILPIYSNSIIYIIECRSKTCYTTDVE